MSDANILKDFLKVQLGFGFAYLSIKSYERTL